MMSGDWLREFGADCSDLADNLESLARGMALEVATVAVPLIQEQWPIDTGFSRDQWHATPTATGAMLSCDADYSSYIFDAGDDERIPVYPSIVTGAIREAGKALDIAGAFADLTEAYVGQGRTTSHLTGVHRKFLIHAPPKERRAWREQCPEMIETITVDGRALEVVPSDVVAAAQAGKGAF